MTIKYILDLTKEEYRDDFVTVNDQLEDDEKEFWQYEARDKLVEKLNLFVDDAKKYKQARSTNKSKTWLSHNAILVTGQRGTGKTVFLRNCKAMWDVYCNKAKKNHTEIHFLEAIDPTMLIEQDNFANVVIAQIYSEVEFKLNSDMGSFAVKEEIKSDFYKKLKMLADALGKKEEFDGCSGIDKVLRYKSGINLERYFHDFVESAIQILDTESFALPIDDVDMALDRAYEVVDDVRRLLGCPYIIPIVSGDYSLYEQMVNIHFDEKAYRDKTKNCEQTVKGMSLSKNLTDAYLTKVFPNQMRITLLPVGYISPMLFIKTSDRVTVYPYREYLEALYNQFYPLCSNDNILKSWPKPSSARELTQFTRAILPIDLELAKNNEKTSYKLWKSFINWAEQKQNGQAYVDVESFLTLKNRSLNDNFNILDLISFNPKVQIKNKHLNWADKSFLHSQLYSLGIEDNSKLIELRGRRFRTTQPWRKSQDMNTWLLDNISLLEFGFKYDDKTLASLPPLEFYHLDSMVTQKEIKKAYESGGDFLSDSMDETKRTGSAPLMCNLNGLLLDIYTYGDLYSTLGNSYQYFFISRAFELIVYSFLMKDNEKIQSSLIGILNRRPFYSIFNVAPTKSIAGGNDEGIDNVTKPNTANVVNYVIFLEQNILNWRKAHRKLFESMDTEKLIPIFSFIFNKTFTAFHLFKFENYIGQDTVKNEYLTDHIRRFELITVNAAYTAMISGESIDANVGITPNQETIRNKQLFESRDRTLSRNMTRFKSQLKETHCVEKQFIDALESHPLFEMIKCKSEKGEVTIEPRIKLGRTVETDSPEKNKTPNSKNYQLPSSLIQKVNDYLREYSDYYDTFKATKRELIEAVESDSLARAYFRNDLENSNIPFEKVKIIGGNKANNFIKVLYELHQKEQTK